MKNFNYQLCVIGGAGRVGLPFAVASAAGGVKTVIYDINAEALSGIAAGIFPFREEGGPEKLRAALAAGTLAVSDTPEVIGESEILVMVVGTPVDEYLNPDLGGITRVIEEYWEHFRDDQLLILRSTVYPGMSKKIQKLFERRGKNVRVAFCPERIAEGRAIAEIGQLPQIVSAFDEQTLARAADFFKKLTPEIAAATPLEAELAKLFSNAWRYISFAAANQFFEIAESFDANYQNIYRVMTYHYPRAEDLPKPGFAAGPCLTKDTMQLSAYYNNNFSLGHAALAVNEGLPKFVLETVKKRLREENIRKKLGFVGIGILGMAFKSGSDNPRDSLSYKLKKIAEFEFGAVRCHDPYVKDKNLVSVEEVLEKSDVVILAAPHAEYKSIEPRKHKKKIFIDIWGLWTV